MLDSLGLYLRYLGVSVRGQMQYRASFLMLLVGHFILTLLEFLTIWVLFDRFGSLRGWTLPEIALFYGMVNMGYALAEISSQGFEQLHLQVRSGDFDRVLLRPRSAALQIAGQQLHLRRFGRLLQGLCILLWAGVALGIVWSAAKIALVCAAILGGACLFYGIFVLQGTLSFWTIETLEIMNTLTNGGVFAAQYPLVLYRPWFRRFFTYVVPLACISYFPALALLDRPDPLGSSLLLQWLAPATGVLFLLASLRIWEVGVRHYRSTGS